MMSYTEMLFKRSYEPAMIMSFLDEDFPQFPACADVFQVVGKCLADGADEYLQILSLCSVIMQQASQS